MVMEALKQQNDQLWRLVERQRHVIFCLRDELDRCKGIEQTPAAPQPQDGGLKPNYQVSEALGPLMLPQSSKPRPRPTLPNGCSAEESQGARPPSQQQQQQQATAVVSTAAVPPAPPSRMPPSLSRSVHGGAPRPPQTTPPTQSQVAHLRTSLHLLSLGVMQAVISSVASKGKEMFHFVILLRIREKEGSSVTSDLWSIVKTYADIAALESKSRAAHKSYASQATLDRLLDKSYFSANNLGPPSGPGYSDLLDARCMLVDTFLVQILAMVVESPFGPFTQQLVDFLATDLCDPGQWVSSSATSSTDTLPSSLEADERWSAQQRQRAYVKKPPRPFNTQMTPQIVVESAPDLRSPPTMQHPAASVTHTVAGLFGHDGGITRLLKKAAPQAGGLARKHFSILIDSPPTPEKPEKKQATPVFGVPLEQAIAASWARDDLELPAVVYRCIEYLDHQDAKCEEGIYRLSGSSAIIRKLKERFNNEGDVDLVKESATGDYLDVHAVSGLLKLFFRELPGSILTDQYHAQFMALQEITDLQVRVTELGKLAAMLPAANYAVLRALIAHLVTVVTHADINKMTIRNLGIVFAPTLGIPAGIFALMLTEGDAAFGIQSSPAPNANETENAPIPEATADKAKAAASDAAVPPPSTLHPSEPPSIATDKPDSRRARRKTKFFTGAPESGGASDPPGNISPRSTVSHDEIADLMGEYESSLRDSRDSEAMRQVEGAVATQTGVVPVGDVPAAAAALLKSKGTGDKDLDGEYERAAQAQQRVSMGFLSYYADVDGHAADDAIPDEPVPAPTPVSVVPPSSTSSSTSSPAPSLAPAAASAVSPRTSSATLVLSNVRIEVAGAPVPHPTVVGQAAAASLSRQNSDSSRTSGSDLLGPRRLGVGSSGSAGGTKRHSMYMEGMDFVSVGAIPPAAEMGPAPDAAYGGSHAMGSGPTTLPPRVTPGSSGSAILKGGLSPEALLAAEANLQALLRTSKDRLSRELANMHPEQIAQLQALLMERAQRQTPSSS